MLILKFLVLFFGTTRIRLHASMPKKHFSFLMLSVGDALFQLLSLSGPSPSPLIGQFAHA